MCYRKIEHLKVKIKLHNSAGGRLKTCVEKVGLISIPVIYNIGFLKILYYLFLLNSVALGDLW